MKKNIPYDEVVVVSTSASALTQREESDLRRAYGNDIGDEFIDAYTKHVASYVEHSLKRSLITHKKTKDRIAEVLRQGNSFIDAINTLEPTDSILIGKFFTRKFLNGKNCISEKEILVAMHDFLDDVKNAANILEERPEGGARPAYAKQALALAIGRSLSEVNGNKFPSQTVGKRFDSILKCAINAGNKRMDPNSKAVMDVKSLMKKAKELFDKTE